MAFTKILIFTAVLAVVHAKFVWQDDNVNQPRMPTPPFQPFAPFPPSALFGNLPGFGQFNNPGFPNFPNFPNFPQIPLPVVPTPGQIANVVPGPGQVFNGVAVKSSSSLSYDKDGKPVRTGGTSIITNNDGNVKEIREGNAPPDINEPIPAPVKLKLDFPKFPSFPEMKPMKFSSFPEIKPLEFPSFPEIKPLEFPEIKMPVFKPIKPIKPIDIDEIKSYIPKDGEKYFGAASSSFSSSKTVNGKTVSDGGSSVFVNDNGNSDEEHVVFHQEI